VDVATRFSYNGFTKDVIGEGMRGIGGHFLGQALSFVPQGPGSVVVPKKKKKKKAAAVAVRRRGE
jgi:hypothetical protein